MANADADPEFARILTLLTGRGGAMSPEQGAAALEARANAGDAHAAALAAIVAGAGFGRPQDWAAALDWLVRAAQGGEAGARTQLHLLANAEGEAGDWRALAERIDIASWIAPRATRSVLEAPRIGVAQGFLDRRLCAWLIARAQPLQAPAKVYNPASGQSMAHDSRSNSAATFTITELDLPMLLIRARIAATMQTPVLNLERFSVFHYLVGQRFSRHVDYLDPTLAQFAEEVRVRGQRALTFLVYLNDDFDRGETEFLALGRKLRGGAGDAVFFYNVDASGAPDRMTLHEGAPPTRGEKWLLSQFIRDKPQRPG